MMFYKLKLAIWNANGLSQHKREVRKFLHDHEIDVMLVSETHFTNKNHFAIRGYIVYDTKHPDGKAHGGTAVLVKRGIKQCEVGKLSRRDIQATCVEIDTHCGNLCLSAVYCPPRFSVKSEEFSAFFESLGKRFLAGGDFNAKHPHWGSRLRNSKGRQLMRTISRDQLVCFSSGQPTYWPSDINKIPDLLDFAVAKGVNHSCVTVDSCYELSSDHSPVIITMQTHPVHIPRPDMITNSLTNWEKYREYLERECSLNVNLKTSSQIESAVTNLTKVIIDAARTATPAPKSNSNPPTSYTPKSIDELIKEKRLARERFNRTRSPEAKAVWNKLTKIVQRALEEHENGNVENFLINLSPKADAVHSLWKAVKGSKRPKICQPPLKREDGGWAQRDEDKAELLATHLASVFKPHPDPGSSDDIEPPFPSINFNNESKNVKIKISQVEAL